MRLLVLISNYGDSQLSYLNMVIDTYLTYKNYDVTVEVDSTVPIGRKDIKETLRDPSIRNFLACVHRKRFIERQDDYDLFLYGENDVLIKESAIDTYLKYDKSFAFNECLGFIRYEVRENNDNLYFPDINAHWPTIKEKNIQKNGQTFFQLHNVHQGCWLLNQEKLKFVINYSDFTLASFQTVAHDTPGILESGASSVFVGWERGVMNKYLTQNTDDLRNCLVHHMSNKYCRLQEPIWQDQPGPMTFNQLTGELKK